VDITGADQLVRLSKALKEAGAKDLQRELSKAINTAMKPVKADLQRSAGSLPNRGGLAARVAKTKYSTRRNKNGLKLVGKGDLSLYHLDQGQVRHRRKDGGWTIQDIKPGWWTDVTDAAAPEVRKEILEAMDEVAKKIDRAVR
jgi:hypothetical protein